MTKYALCDKNKCCCDQVVEQAAFATTTQEQQVNQENFNLQIATIAIATNGGTAKATQTSCQENTTLQKGIATAANFAGINCENCCGETFQNAFAEVDQNFVADVGATNVQLVEVAVESNDGVSVERACSNQNNNFSQIASASTRNYNSSPLETAKKPDTVKQESTSYNSNRPENLDSLLNQGLLSTVNVNGKEIKKEIKPGGATIKKVNAKDKTSTKDFSQLNPGAFHVVLNLAGESLDIQADSKGQVLVNGTKLEESTWLDFL